MCLACDRDQAQIVLGYTRSYFENIAPFRAMVQRETASGFELNNGVDIAIATNSYRAVRGRTLLLAVLDECAFYRDERSATPDEETYRAVAPGLARMPGSMLIGISTPHAKRRLLYRKFTQHYGRDGDVLVIKAPSIVFNPTLDQASIDQALAEDPFGARAEWLAEFRDDLESYASLEALRACVSPGVRERLPQRQFLYRAFCDPAGGSGKDSMTLAVAHREGGTVILDAVREAVPQFSPEAVVEEFSDVLKNFRITRCCGDRFGGLWCVEAFRRHGINYELSDQTRSQLYINVLPLVNSRAVDLLDNDKMIQQFAGLERATGRGRSDSIDHDRGPGAHDDVANAVAGALVLASALRGDGTDWKRLRREKRVELPNIDSYHKRSLHDPLNPNTGWMARR
jgi:hypothetical protein